MKPLPSVFGWFASALILLLAGRLQGAPSPIGTGQFSNITLGALQNPAAVNRQWPDLIDYDVDPGTWTYDVYVPPTYDGTKPYGVVVFITSDSTPGVVLQTASSDKNLIWISPRNVGNNQGDYTLRFGASLLALYRAKEMFNIDSRRVYTSGKSGGARIASALAFYHSEIIKGTAPSAGFCLPRLNAVTPDYVTNSSGQTDSYYDYSLNWFFGEDVNAINATGLSRKVRSYLITHYDDYRDYYFVESFHCAYEPQGQICFLSNAPGGHQDPSDAEMEEAIGYLDRDDIFPVNANATAGAGGFSGMSNISQSGASAVEATSGGKTTYTLTPTLGAVAATKTGSTFYWDNVNGSTVRWLWEVKNAAPTNQKTCFGLWFAGETWGGGAPVSVTSGTNPGILITITQNGSLNRMVVSARSDSGGETIFYDGYCSFVPAYSTAWTSTQTGYLSGTGSPVEIRMDLNRSRWQLTFNGINLNGATNSIASGTQIPRVKANDSDNKRMIYGYWDSALGTSFWKHDIYTSRNNTWSPLTKSILTAATGALSGTGVTPSPMELRYVIASDPNLPDPPLNGPPGLAASSTNSVVNLTWNALAGATSYTVQRSSVSGGPYTTIQSGITGTSYTDSAVTSGNIYYYTIFAVTASGNTAIVPEVVVGVNLSTNTWTGGGADGSWQTAANWSSLPAANSSLFFAGSARLTSTNNFAANMQFSGLSFNSGAGAFALAGNAITLSGNIANNSSSTQTISLPEVLTSGTHSVTTNASGAVSISGAISGSGSVLKSGTGTLTLSGANSYNGGTTISVGTLAVGNSSAFGTGSVTLNGGTFKASGGYTLTNSFAVNAGSIIDMGGNNTGLSSNLSGSGALTLNNSGAAATMTLSGNNSGYSGTFTVNGGNAMNFTSANAGSASAAWVFNDATGDRVRINVGNNTLNFGSIAGSGQMQNDTGSTTTTISVGALNTTTIFSGTIKDNGSGILSLVKVGTGITALSGANTYSGGTTINNGTIGCASATGTNTNLGNGLVTVNPGAILRVGYSVTSNQNISTTGNNITLAGGTIFVDDANQHLGGNVNVSVSGTLGSTYNAGNNSAAEKDKGLAVDGIVSGTGALTIQQTRINTGNSYDTSFVSFSNNANNYSGTVTINENTTTSEGGVYLGVNGSTALQNATIVTSAIPGTNLKFGSSPIVFKTGLGSATIGAISGSAPIVLTGYDEVNHSYGTDAIALTVGGNNATTTYSAAISGTGSLIKSGIGMMTLTATNTYAGATTISGGILNITGALGVTSGTVSVNNGGTLSGTGTVARATTVSGAISPGNGGSGIAGTLTFSSGLTLNSGAVLNLELSGTSTSDKIALSGSFVASGTTTINLTAITGFAGSGAYAVITGATGISAGNFVIGSTPSGYVGTLSASSGTLSVTMMTLQENWRYTNFGTTSNSGNAADSADPDGDGMTNSQEFIAGSNPNDRSSVLKISQLAVSGNDVLVSFASVAGKNYRVESSTTLQNGSWTTVQTNIAGTGGTVQISHANGATQPKQFYRVVVLP